MSARLKRHGAQFKARIGLEALNGRKGIQQIAKEKQIHSTQLSQWKQEFGKRFPLVFESPSQGSEKDWGKEREHLHAKIAQQIVEIDWLAKKCELLHF